MDDKPKIIRLVEHTWSWGDYIPGVLDQWLTEPAGKVFLCTSGGQVVGMVHLSVEDGLLGWLEGARVAVDHRNRGVATMLAKHAVEYASRLGLAKLRLAIAVDNAPSIRHVEKVGFRPLTTFKRVSAQVSLGGGAPTSRALSEHEIDLVLGSKWYAAYRGLYYKAFRWLDLSGDALQKLSLGGRGVWVGGTLIIHSSEYDEGGRVAEIGYAQLGDAGDLRDALTLFASKGYSKVEFIVPHDVTLEGHGLVETGGRFTVFELVP